MHRAHGIALGWLIRILGAELGDESWGNRERSIWSVSGEDSKGKKGSSDSSKSLGNDSHQELGDVLAPVSLLLFAFAIFLSLVHISKPNSKTDSWVEVS